jgi:hypothetical protein
MGLLDQPAPLEAGPMPPPQTGLLAAPPVQAAPDMTYQFNTPLSSEEEAAFQKWATDSGRTGDTRDYDLRGAWKSDAKAAANGHLPDTWKKPNHPTFSDESQYKSPDRQGGKWIDLGKGKWAFQATKANIDNLGIDGLKRYFKKVEPGAVLILPDGTTVK